MTMTNEELLIEQKGFIESALTFIGEDHTDLLVTIKEGSPADHPIIYWELKLATGKLIAGQYDQLEWNNAHMAVIMAIGLTRHTFSWLIFDIMVMASQVMHLEPNRNTTPEIAVRWLIRDGLRTRDMKHIRDYLEDKLHLSKNIAEENIRRLAHKVRKN